MRKAPGWSMTPDGKRAQQSTNNTAWQTEHIPKEQWMKYQGAMQTQQRTIPRIASEWRSHNAKSPRMVNDIGWEASAAKHQRHRMANRAHSEGTADEVPRRNANPAKNNSTNSSEWQSHNAKSPGRSTTPDGKRAQQSANDTAWQESVPIPYLVVNIMNGKRKSLEKNLPNG